MQRYSIHAAGHHATRVCLTKVYFPSQLISCVLITSRWKIYSILSSVFGAPWYIFLKGAFSWMLEFIGQIFEKMLSKEHLRNINSRLSTFTFENSVKFVLCHRHFTSHIPLLASSLFLPISKPFTYLCQMCLPYAMFQHFFLICLNPFDQSWLFWMNSWWCITCNTLFLFKR